MKKFITSLLFLIALFSSCQLAFQKLMGKKDSESGNTSNGVQLDFLSWNKMTVDLKVGGMDSIMLTARPENKRQDAVISYNYNAEIIKVISDSRGVIIEGLKSGKTTLSAVNGKLTTNCIINVDGYDANYKKDPYIYSSNNIIQLKPGSQERVAVSLYGGSAEDSQHFTWVNEKNDVAEIAANGQFCVIKAKGEGNSKITITHPKAAYPYTMLVYSLPDTQNPVYITTRENVITLQKDKGEKQISVSMQNAKDNINPSLYKWELVKKEGDNVCSVDSNQDKAVITPLNQGTALLKVSHPAASYPLEILVRVVELVNNVYIEPSSTYVEVKGSESKNIKVELKGYTETYDVNAFDWQIPENDIIDENHYGNEIVISGKKNGIVKITVNHPLSSYPREIMVNVKEQKNGAVDSSMYITTNQNYIRTKVGAEPTSLNVLLYGGDPGDQRNFIWKIKETPKYSGRKVIKFETAHGQVMRSASLRPTASYEDGQGYITPLSEGSAVIEISHPKVLYPTEVLVKVLPEYAVLDEPLYFSGDSLLKILNGGEKEAGMHLIGKNKMPSDEDKISWATDSRDITVLGRGGKGLIKATGRGSHISAVDVTHPKVEDVKKITVLTADTQAELDALKVLYSHKGSYKIRVGESLPVYTENTGFTDEEIKRFIFKATNPDLINVEPHTESGKTVYNMCKITGVKTGECKLLLKANVEGVKDLVLTVTVYPKDADLSKQPDEVYFTTDQNVVHLNKAGQSASVEVQAIGLSSSKKSQIKWEAEKEGVISVHASGTQATFTSIKEGEVKVFVSHPESQNKLTIFVKVGKALIHKEDRTVYIATNTDALHLVKGSRAERLEARLVNYSSPSNDFEFSIDKPAIAELSASDSGTCFVKPIKAGQAMITIKNNKSKFAKNVIVIVANSQEELNGLVYLTTASNVVTVAKGQSKNISVAVMNSKETVIDGFSWESYNPEIATVQSSGATAVLHANEVGTTKIKVSNTHCSYPLEIIVICVDPAFAAKNPYIATPSNVLTLKAEQAAPWSTVSATLEGGSEFDQQNFSWQIEDSSIVQMFGQGNSCKMRAVKPGTTRLVITHPKATHPCYVLLICDEVPKKKHFISVAENIITMKPQDAERAITATLVNGDVEDKYAFNWYADTYDVIELNYSANVASIKPIAQGQTTLHVTHPKAAFEQQIIIKVSEFKQFEFGMEYYKIVAGKTAFIPMRVPVTNVPCHVEYESLNNKVCAIEGTAKIAQVTALKEGNTKVKAKLVTTKTGVVQATAEMLINVEPAEKNLVYITSAKTIFSIEKNTTQTISASITGDGIGIVDQQNLKWKSSDPTVIKLAGASSTGIATGPECMMQALNSGECTVTVSHEKANTDLVLKVIVPGTDEIDIKLNKTYIRLETGGRTEVRARLSNAKPEDYKTIEWSIEKQNGNTIAEILGKGETVALFAKNVGKSVLRARLPNGKQAECEVSVESSRTINFGTQEILIEPGQTKTVKYTVTPDNTGITWTTNSDAYFSYSVDEHSKTVTIKGIKEGFARLTGVTQYGSRATLAVRCTWDYRFTVDKTIIKSEPEYDAANPDKFIINYQVTPSDAEIEVTLLKNKNDFVNYVIDKQKRQIILTPVKEGSGELKLTATNARDNNYLIGSRAVHLNFAYTDITFVPEIVEKDGNFSRYDDNKNRLVIGDGEKVTFRVRPDKVKADAKVRKVEFTPKDKNVKMNFAEAPESGGDTYNLAHPEDKKEIIYKIDKTVKLYAWTGYAAGSGSLKECSWIDWRVVDSKPHGYPGDTYRTGKYANGIYADGSGETMPRIYGDAFYAMFKFETTPCEPYYVSEQEFYNNTLWYKQASWLTKWVTKWVWKEAWLTTSWVEDGSWTYPASNLHGFKSMASFSTNAKKYEYAGMLTITFIKQGQTEVKKVPVWYEERPCEKTYKKQP